MSVHNELILLCVVVSVMGVCSHPLEDEFLNVGTVLFSPTDLKKTHWPKSELALLQARSHFQKLIPPPNFIDPSKDYIDRLLSYFKEAFMAIKGEANDPSLDSIMTTALADAVGGYLKLWILPMTKFCFYGGTVSYDNSYKIFNFYDEIKKYLVTDGSGWKSPDDKILNTISVNVPRTRLHVNNAKVRCSHDPCEQFAYFERTSNGFTIPLPTINWADNTMFIPIKKNSFVSLSSSKYYNSLQKYYTEAKHCLQLRSANASDEFDGKFQIWLSQDVVPHLMDDSLYVALGNVLTLTNSNNLPYTFFLDEDKSEGVMSYLTMILAQAQEKAKCISCSKKVLFFSLLLLIEIIWCAIAIKHSCLKTKNKKSSEHNNLTLYFKSFRDHSLGRKSTSAEINSVYIKKHDQLDSIYTFNQYSGSYDDVIGGGLKLPEITKSKRAESGAQVPSKEIKSTQIAAPIDDKSISSKEFVSIINECQPLLQRCPSKHIQERVSKEIPERISKTSQNVSFKGDSLTKSSNYVVNTVSSNQHTCNCACCSQERPDEDEDTITLFRKSQRSIERAMFESEENTTQLRRSISERPKRTPTLDLFQMVETDVKVSDTPFVSDAGDNHECTCDCGKHVPQTLSKPSHELNYTCMNMESQTTFKSRKTENVTQTPETVVMCVNQQTDSTINKSPRTSLAVQKVKSKVKKDLTKKKDGKRSVRKPYLEIKIDRPNAEIKVGISNMDGKRAGTPRNRSQSHTPKKTITSDDRDPRDSLPCTESNETTQSEYKCFKKIVNYQNNKSSTQAGSRLIHTDTRTVIESQLQKLTQERSTEAVPILVDDDTEPDRRCTEQAAGSYTICSCVETGANTSLRRFNDLSTSSKIVASKESYNTHDSFNAALMHYSKQELIASPHLQKHHIPSLELKSESITEKGQAKRNEHLIQKTDDSEDVSSNYPIVGPRQNKIKKRKPGMIPKYLRHAVEEQNKAKQGPEYKKMETDKVSGDPNQIKHDQRPRLPSKTAQPTTYQAPKKTSSPIRGSPTTSMKSACSPVWRSDNVSQCTNKNADATCTRNKRGSQEPTPGVPTKTKIPVSPKRLKQDSPLTMTAQKVDNANSELVDENKVQLKKASVEPEHVPPVRTRKKSPAALKYSKRYASAKPNSGIEKPKVKEKSPLVPTEMSSMSHDDTEAQKIISEIITKGDPIPKKNNIKYRSYIPRLKKLVIAADDIELENDKKGNESDKLNVTL